MTTKVKIGPTQDGGLELLVEEGLLDVTIGDWHAVLGPATTLTLPKPTIITTETRS